MRCPICGSKMPQGKMCMYCKITGEQVTGASNIKAKKAIKQGDRSKVHYSSVMPQDVNRTKLMLLTILLGFFGAGNFYVGKYLKGTYCAVSWIVYLPVGITAIVLQQRIVALTLCAQIMSLLVAVSLILWVADIISLLMHSYKVPVVLGEKLGK